MRDYSKNSVDELRGMLESRGLPGGGNKQVLIGRLEADDDFPGRVEIPSRKNPPGISSLVEAFENREERASDTIVLRGYLGRSDLLQWVVDYLRRSKRIENADANNAVGEAAVDEENDIEALIARVKALARDADEHIPWRIYLTPRLDRYVDFHFKSMLAYRREPKAERQDACTVWLRLFEEGGRVPIPYRVVHVTNLGPSFAQWLGGDLVDDYLGQPGSVSSAWGDQSAVFGRRPSTGVYCGTPRTGVYCGE